MSIIENSPLPVETPAIPALSTNAQVSATHHMHRLGAATLAGITLTRRYTTRATQDVIKPAIKTFLETCDTHPRIAAVVATPALLGFLVVLAVFTISTLFLVAWTILTVTSGIIFVIIAGILSLFFKLLVMVLATLPLAAIATGLLVGANAVSQSIISRLPRNGVSPAVTQTAREIDWKSVREHLINLGRNLGPGSAALMERLMTALHNVYVAFKSGTEDLHNTEAENIRNVPPSDCTAETNSQRSQGDSNSVGQNAQSVFEYGGLEELQPTGSTEGLKRRAPFPLTKTREDENSNDQ